MQSKREVFYTLPRPQALYVGKYKKKDKRRHYESEQNKLWYQ